MLRLCLVFLCVPTPIYLPTPWRLGGGGGPHGEGAPTPGPLVGGPFRPASAVALTGLAPAPGSFSRRPRALGGRPRAHEHGEFMSFLNHSRGWESIDASRTSFGWSGIHQTCLGCQKNSSEVHFMDFTDILECVCVSFVSFCVS